MQQVSETTTLLPTSRKSAQKKKWLLLFGVLGIGCVAVIVSITSFNSGSNNQQVVSALQAAEVHSAQSVDLDSTDAETVQPHSLHGSYMKAAVAADSDICSQIGVDTLRQGGSAVDSAIATGICVGVVNSQSSGVTGGHFMLIYESPRNSTKKEMIGIDSWNIAPLAAADPHLYDQDPGAKDLGPMSITVPGEINGYYLAWERFGRLQWKDLFTPSIKLCKQGFRMGQALSDTVYSYRDRVYGDTGLREVFTRPDGTLHETGDILRFPKLGASLEKIAKEGRDTLYNGSLAKDLVADIQDLGGVITLEDLPLHKPIWRKPVRRHLENGHFDVYGMGPTAGGTLIQFVLGVMNNYNYEPSMVESLDGYVLFLHRLLEALKLGWEQYMKFGDPDFADKTTLTIMKNMESSIFTQESFSKINDTAAQAFNDYNANIEMEIHANTEETTHVSVFTEEGSTVAVTTTIDTFLGCGHRGMRTGLILNNIMKMFGLPGDVNRPANIFFPGKRPQSTKSPTIVLNQFGDVVLSVGASGGTHIESAIILVTAHVLWLGKNLTDAVDAARVHADVPPDLTLQHDEFISQNILDGLKEKGHTRQQVGVPYMAIVQAIDTRTWSDCTPDRTVPCIHAVSDFRKGGAPAGF